MNNGATSIKEPQRQEDTVASVQMGSKELWHCDDYIVSQWKIFDNKEQKEKVLRPEQEKVANGHCEESSQELIWH